jgi:hypothetical protein
MSRIFFPLRTSVELFDDRSNPEAVTRVKQAAILYDDVIVEGGLADIAITPTGATNWWHPTHLMTPEMLSDTRRPKPGSPMTLAFGKQDAAGQPAKEMHVAIDGTISAAYVAEFHTGILDELRPLDPDWLTVYEIGTSDVPPMAGDDVKKAIGKLNFRDLGDPELMPDTESFQKSYIYKSFNRDSTVAADIGASFSISPLFAPMIERRGIEPDFAGAEALSILVPNVGPLPWEAILEFREHPGSAEARECLRGFDEKAAREEPQDAYDFLKQVSREVTQAYRATIDELKPNLPAALAKEVTLGAVSLVPTIGPVWSAGLSLSMTADESRNFNRSWIAAVMKSQAWPD